MKLQSDIDRKITCIDKTHLIIRNLTASVSEWSAAWVCWVKKIHPIRIQQQCSFYNAFLGNILSHKKRANNSPTIVIMFTSNVLISVTLKSKKRIAQYSSLKRLKAWSFDISIAVSKIKPVSRELKVRILFLSLLD